MPDTSLAPEALPPAPDDPMPAAPLPPDDSACCGSGCDPCIWDWYQQERERYQAEMKAWQARRVSALQAQSDAGSAEGAGG